jgi:hypothetical protein
MLIRVTYQNDKHDLIKPLLLDHYISSNKIKKFLRSEGWITVGTDKIRGKGGHYEGPERRKNVEFRQEARIFL